MSTTRPPWPRGASRVVPLLLAAVLAMGSTPASAQRLGLAEALDAALATHPSVRGAQARLDAAGAASRAARAAFLPSVAGATGLTRHAEPMVVAPLHGFDPTHPPDFDRTLVQSQLLMEFTLFDGGARRAGVRGAEAAEDAAGLRRDVTVEELLETVVGAYTGILATRALREAAERQVASLAAELDRAQRRLAEGTAARVEVLRAEAALQDARAQAASTEVRTGLAERTLARLMGVPAETITGRTLEDLEPSGDAGSAHAAADTRVEAARRAVAAARARWSQERAGRLPALKASAGLLGFGSSSTEHVTEWQAGVRISWPLFTGGARTAAIRRAEAEVRAAEEELRLAELSSGSALDAADAALAEAVARARALEASVAQWEEVARIEALSLETGSGVQQDRLRAEAALFQARAGLARARYDEILAWVGRARVQGRLDRTWMDRALEVGR